MTKRACLSRILAYTLNYDLLMKLINKLYLHYHPKTVITQTGRAVRDKTLNSNKTEIIQCDASSYYLLFLQNFSFNFVAVC